jgi:DNA-binding NarL/FixJ family response regulator
VLRFRSTPKKPQMSSSKQITVLLAEDHAIVRQGLCALLNAHGNFGIVGQARTGREAVQMAHTLKPDVILMDIAMPVLNGLEATRQILAKNPAARVIILSAHSDDEYIERTRDAGVAGFLEKQTSAEILTKAIREVAMGNTFFSPSIAKRILTQVRPRNRNGLIKSNRRRLTSRESEVLQLVAEGSANKQVAAQLGISVKTVEKHRQHLMDKLNIHDTAGLTRYAIAAGVIESSVQLTIV